MEAAKKSTGSLHCLFLVRRGTEGQARARDFALYLCRPVQKYVRPRWRSFSDILPPVCSYCSILRSYRVVSVRRPNTTLSIVLDASRAIKITFGHGVVIAGYRAKIRASVPNPRVFISSLRCRPAALRRPHIKDVSRTRERSLRKRGFESFGLNNFKSWHIYRKKR